MPFYPTLSKHKELTSEFTDCILISIMCSLGLGLFITAAFLLMVAAGGY